MIITVASLAMAGVFAAYSFVKLFGISFLANPRSKHAENAREVPKSMLASMGILSFLCLVSGLLPMFIIKLLDFINYEVFETVIAGEVKGFSSFVFYPVNSPGSIISPLGIFLLALIICCILFYGIYFVIRNKTIRYYNTWDCGYISLNSRMQYSATGFSKPIRIVLRSILKPLRELKVEEGVSPYFMNSAKYVVSTESIFEKYLYAPVVRRIIYFARRTRLLIQTGSVHTYLIYMFVVLVALFTYYVISGR
jgi:hydrogenase-4 component B